jgi:iron(II)-dependent oxidoreductase
MNPDPSGIRSRLESVRERTLSLVAPLDWPVLRKQHIPILSPMVWDLGHIGQFEEMWLLGELTGAEPLTRGYAEMFDPARNPRPTREALPLPERPVLFDYLGRLRERVLGDLNGAGARSGGGAAADPARRERLLAGGFVHELVAEHEEQHQETILQALQTCTDPPYRPALRRPAPPGRAVDAPGLSEGMVRIPAGPFRMGTDRPGFAYDNERRAHEVDLPDYWIETVPVTNRDYLAFLEAGGYREPRFWTEAGWAWREETAAEAPLYWRRDGGRWLRRRFADEREPPPREPVMHVSYWEADAYARWAGKRLPTEAEWEKAALWDPAAGRKRLHPWGDEPPTPERANVDQLAFGPAEAGAYPAGASAYGVHGMIGDAWEWTSSDFAAYPGFEAFPYREYSEVFFGPDYKVLRGGSWATRPAVARGTFRNWDYPIRRQIFTGIRCARDG